MTKRDTNYGLGSVTSPLVQKFVARGLTEGMDKTRVQIGECLQDVISRYSGRNRLGHGIASIEGMENTRLIVGPVTVQQLVRHAVAERIQLDPSCFSIQESEMQSKAKQWKSNGGNGTPLGDTSG